MNHFFIDQRTVRMDLEFWTGQRSCQRTAAIAVLSASRLLTHRFRPLRGRFCDVHFRGNPQVAVDLSARCFAVPDHFMKAQALFFGLFAALTCAFAGCEPADHDEYNGPGISLSSLQQAAEAIETRDRLTLPMVVDDSLWDLQPCRPTPAWRPINLSRAIQKKVRIWGLAVSNASGKAIVTYMDQSSDRKSRKTGGAYCDLHTGRVISMFDLPDFAAPYSIDPSGKYAILSRADGVLSERETLYIARLDKQQVLQERWRPLVDPSVETPRSYVDGQVITWASFVGSDRIVTVNNQSVLHVWSFPERKRIGSFVGVDAMPSLSPDRTHVVFAGGDMLCLLDPSEPAIVGYRRVGPVPKEAVVAVDPNGRQVAVGGKGEAMIIDLAQSGYFRIFPKYLSAAPGADLIPDFAFIGSFLHDTRQLYDFDSPTAVWSIGSTAWQLPVGDAYWAVVRQRAKGKFVLGSSELVLRCFKIPDAEIKRSISQVYRTADVLALRAGDSVRIDVSGLPAERRSEMREALEQALAKKGFLLADSAAVTVKAFADPEREFQKTYIQSKGSLPFTPVFVSKADKDKCETFSYRGRVGQLWITKNGRKLWSRSGIEQPPNWLNEVDVPEDGKLDFYADPKYSIFTDPQFPDFIAGDYTGVLGTTTLQANGLKSQTNKPRRKKK